MDDRIRTLAQKIWNYHQLNHALAHADAIFVLCSHDAAVAVRGAELFLAGWAPLLIFSGGLGAITRHLWHEPEADQFAAIAQKMGVPRDRMLIENRSTNTGENVLFTKKLLADRGIDPQTFILVQKPYMERRTYATFKRHWPEKDLMVTSPRVSFDQYLHGYSNSALSVDDVIAIMVGDLQRIRVYPSKGFQIAQDIPDDVWDAFEELVRAGYEQGPGHQMRIQLQTGHRDRQLSVMTFQAWMTRTRDAITIVRDFSTGHSGDGLFRVRPSATSIGIRRARLTPDSR